MFRNRRRGFHADRIVGKDYLDIGCGPLMNDTFIGLDFNWHPELDICCDVTHGLPLPDERVKGVFTEHCIEHLELRDTYELLGEIHRVLRPGGTVRIIVPDVQIYARGYLANLDGSSTEPLPLRELDGVDGIYTPAMSLNRIFNEWGHRFIFDVDTLGALLERQGFVDVAETSFRSGRDPVLLQDSEEHISESLYLEASKPA